MTNVSMNLDRFLVKMGELRQGKLAGQPEALVVNRTIAWNDRACTTMYTMLVIQNIK